MLKKIINDLKGFGHTFEIQEVDSLKHGVIAEIIVNQTDMQKIVSHLPYCDLYLECLTAIDFADCWELVYIFNHWIESSRFSIKSILPKDGSKAISIADIYGSADWYEREIWDMFGLQFEGKSNMERLLLPTSSTIHPLAKSFKGEPDGSDVKQVMQLLAEEKNDFEVTFPASLDQSTDTYYLNLGPQHPSTHGVLKVILKLKGERVLEAKPVIGYVHRNHEKMAEIQEYKAFWPNIGRLDYVGAMSYNFAYAGLIEKAMGIEIPRRVEFIRVITTELNRIASHLLWLGTYLLDLGAFTPFFHCFDDREQILTMLEHVTGERLTYDYFRFGGLDADYPDDKVTPLIDKFIPHFKKRLDEYHRLIGENIIFKKRTIDIGHISKKVALQYGITGPNLRACGIRSDIRRSEPYSIYSELDFEIPTQTEGDAYARYLVRMSEMAQCLKIIEQIYTKIPKGEYKANKLPRFVPKGEYYHCVESARGSFGMYLVSDGSMQAYRLKLRTPSFSNLSAFDDISKGCFLSDVMSILGSIDIVIPEIDR